MEQQGMGKRAWQRAKRERKIRAFKGLLYEKLAEAIKGRNVGLAGQLRLATQDFELAYAALAESTSRTERALLRMALHELTQELEEATDNLGGSILERIQEAGNA